MLQVTLYQDCLLRSSYAEGFDSQATLEEYLNTLNKITFTLDASYPTLSGTFPFEYPVAAPFVYNYCKFVFSATNEEEIPYDNYTYYAFIDTVTPGNGVINVSYSSDIWATFMNKGNIQMRASVVNHSRYLPTGALHYLPIDYQTNDYIRWVRLGETYRRYRIFAEIQFESIVSAYLSQSVRVPMTGEIKIYKNDSNGNPTDEEQPITTIAQAQEIVSYIVKMQNNSLDVKDALTPLGCAVVGQSSPFNNFENLSTTFPAKVGLAVNNVFIVDNSYVTDDYLDNQALNLHKIKIGKLMHVSFPVDAQINPKPLDPADKIFNKMDTNNNVPNPPTLGTYFCGFLDKDSAIPTSYFDGSATKHTFIKLPEIDLLPVKTVTLVNNYKIVGVGCFSNPVPFNANGSDLNIKIYMSISNFQIHFYLSLEGQLFDISSMLQTNIPFTNITQETYQLRRLADQEKTMKAIGSMISGVGKLGPKLGGLSRGSDLLSPVGGMLDTSGGIFGAIGSIITATSPKYQTSYIRDTDSFGEVNALNSLGYMLLVNADNEDQVDFSIKNAGYECAQPAITTNPVKPFADSVYTSKKACPVQYGVIKLYGSAPQNILQRLEGILRKGIKVYFSKEAEDDA